MLLSSNSHFEFKLVKPFSLDYTPVQKGWEIQKNVPNSVLRAKHELT